MQKTQGTMTVNNAQAQNRSLSGIDKNSSDNTETRQAAEIASLRERLHSLETQATEMGMLEQELNDSITRQRIIIAELEGRSSALESLIAEKKQVDTRYRELFDLAPVGYLSLNADGLIDKANLSATSFLQLPSTYLINSPFTDFLHERDCSAMQEYLSSTDASHLSFRREVALKLPDGSFKPVLLVTSAIRSAQTTSLKYQIMIMDITQQLKTEKLLRNANEFLENLAHQDPLTHLPNRARFTESLSSKLIACEKSQTKLGVVYFDLDGFKPINDTLGHHVGDQVLCEVAQRIDRYLGPDDIVARIGGDEFTVILHNPVDEADAVERCQRIAELIRTPIRIDERDVRVTGSIGVGLYPDHATNADELVKGADAAMYLAKQAGRDCIRLFSKISADNLSRKAELVTSMAHALEADQFELHFQPIYNTTTLTIVSIEALLRWKHPTLGAVPPSEFIPLAEKSGRIIELGAWVLEQACRQARAWHNEGYDMPVAINVSTRQLLETDFDKLVENTLRRYQLPRQALEMEITESAIMADQDQCHRTLRHLRQAGHVVSIDDFGTGHSSLARLVHLPLSQLKIDRTFIKEIEHSTHTRSVIKSIIVMAHELDMRVVSEGIETAGQLEFLVQSKCDAVQGFMMSRAQLPEDITRLLRLDRERVSGLCLDLPELGLEKISS